MEQPKLFRTFKEISAREAFDPECEITPENFARLVAPYHLSHEEEVHCQVRPPGQKARCNEGHSHGWLGRCKDGKEALIGVICGGKYFNASETFRADRRRITSELNIARHLEQLQETRGRPAYAAELERAITSLKRLRTGVESWRERLPPSIVSRLQKMAKSGIGAVCVLFRYEEEDDNGNPKIEWSPNQIEPIAGFVIWDQPRIGALFKALHEIQRTHKEAVIDRSSGERKLRAWAEKLGELPIRVREVAALESALSAFSEPTNLKRLCFTVRNQNDGISAARVAIEQESGSAAATRRTAERLYHELSADISARANGRAFRIDEF